LHVDQKLVDVSSALGADPMHWVLTGGEDHALVATFPPYTELPPGWQQIGVVRLPDSGVTVDDRHYDGQIGCDLWRGRRPVVSYIHLPATLPEHDIDTDT